MNRKNTVDYQELLKRYYEGKTTLEEEKSAPDSLPFPYGREPCRRYPLPYLGKRKPNPPARRDGTTSGSLDRPAICRPLP